MHNSNLLFSTIIIGALTVGFACGYLGFIYLGDISKQCQVSYVAEDEIMELERKRVESEKLTPQKQDLFFGNIDKAVSLTERLAQNKNSRNTKVIFSIAPVFGSGVESISKQVHREVINELQNSRER